MLRPRQLTTTAAPPALPPDERHRILILWNLTEAPYPRQATLHDVLLEAMAAAGDAPAVLTGDYTTSHADLARRARQLARLLRGLGAAPRRFVAVAAEDPQHAVTASLAVLLTGAAVVPIDPRWPAERTARVLTTCNARLLVGDEAARARLPRSLPSALWIDALPEPGLDPGEPAGDEPRAGPTDPACALFGPTAGTVLTHRNLVSHVMARAAAHGEPQRVLVLSPRASAGWLGAVAWTLAGGGALALPDGDDEPAAVLRALVARAQVTHLVAPPHRHEALLAGADSLGDLGSLRVVALDATCPPTLASRHRAVIPGARLFVNHGPDEAAGLAACHEVVAGTGASLVPIGRPVQNARCYVVDARAEPAAPGETGELWIGGETVAAAYLGRAELTRARFGPDPFRKDEPGARVFRTGSRARWRSDGVLELVTPDPTCGPPGPPSPDAPPARAPLAPSQEVFWLHDRLDPGSSTYAVVACLRLRGELDAAAAAAAVAALARRHDALRVRIVTTEGGAPAQEEDPEARLELAVETRPGAPLREVVRRAAREPLPLDRAPLARALLVREGESEHALVLVLHHIICDGTSISVLLEDLAALYAAARAGRSPDGALPPARSWRLMARDARARLTAREPELRRRWRERLQDAPAPTALPADGPRRVEGERVFGHVLRDVPEAAVGRARALAHAHGGTVAMAALAALHVVVHRWTGEQDLLLGAAVSLRDRADAARTVGCLVGSALLRVRLAPAAPFSELLARSRDALLDALTDGQLPVHALLEDVARRDGRPFHLLFNALPPRPPLEGWDRLDVELVDFEDPSTAFDATLYLQERGGRLRLELVHDARLLGAARAEAFVEQVASVLEQAAADPSRPVSAFDLSTPAGRVVLPDLDAPLAPAPATTIHGPFEAVAAARPRAIAVSDPARSWTYEELASRARAVARDLRAAGVAPGDRVAVWAHRSVPLAAALLGVLRAGAAFAVLDPEHPPIRLARQLLVLAPRAVLALPAAGPLPREVEAAAGPATAVVLLDEAGEAPDDVDPPRVAPDALAYAAFTSGTTGVPKAVEGEHGPVAAFLEWQRRRFGLGAADRVSVLSGLGHDPLLRDLFAPLTSGGSARFPDPRVRHDPARLLAWLRDERVTVAHVTPGLLTVLAAAPAPAAALPDLRLVLSGGDRLTRGDVKRLRAIAPAARVVNGYGTTETPQVIAFHEPSDDEPAADCPTAVVPVGRGVDGVQLLVLRPDGALAAVGELGELHVRTPRLTRGYVDDPELTAARFLPAPRAQGPWDRMVRTGDLGRYAPDGAVEVVRRADRQVKVRGHRVELGEVEAALAAVSGVERAVAAVREGPAGPRLLAWARTLPGALLSSEGLRARLDEVLPPAAVPFAVGVLEAGRPWPLTPNGKVDVSRLPEPAAERAVPQHQEPRTQTEALIARLWTELLGVERVSIRDDFFALGGHSLLAVRMLGLLGERLGTVVPVAALLRAPTIAELAASLHDDGACPEEPLIVEVRPAAELTDLRPLWLLHPVGGHVVFGRRLATRIQRRRPVLGIQAQGLDGRRPPNATVDEMVACYLALIRARQPRGPYHLAGPSFGGVLAWELARRLAHEGEQVGLVALLDTFAPGYPRRKRLPLRLVDHARALVQGGGWEERREYLRVLALGAGARLLGVEPSPHLQVRDAIPGAAAGRGELAGAVRRVALANYEASARHVPGPFPGRVLLVRAARRPTIPGRAWDDLTNGWGALAGLGVDVHVVDATHQTVVDPPAVDEVGAVLDAALRELA